MTTCDNKTSTDYFNNISFQPVTTGLKLWYTPDNGDNLTWIDRSTNLRDSTLFNCNRENIGLFGSAVSLIDNFGYIIPSSTSGNLKTIDSWLYIPSGLPTTFRSIHGFGSSNMTIHTSNNNIYFKTGNGSDLISFPIPFNRWFNVTCVVNGTVESIYINGTISATGISAWSAIGSPIIGNYSFGGNLGSIAKFGDVKFYSTVLSDTDITYNYTHSPFYYINNTI